MPRGGRGREVDICADVSTTLYTSLLVSRWITSVLHRLLEANPTPYAVNCNALKPYF